DPYRDYDIEAELSDIIRLLSEQGDIIDGVAKQLIDYTGQRGSQSSTLYRLSYQLKEMAKEPETIPRRLNDFKTNIGNLGTWILSAREQPLEIDYLLITSPKEKLTEVDTQFTKKVAHEFRAFIAS